MLTLNETPGALKRLRRKAEQQHQVTIHIVPSRSVQFVQAIVSALGPFEGGSATIEDIIFEPLKLNALLAKHGHAIPQRKHNRYLTDWTLENTDRATTEELLMALLADPIDLFFVPNPASFMIYGDHDEYVTFFSRKKSPLTQVVKAISENKFEFQDYQRSF